MLAWDVRSRQFLALCVLTGCGFKTPAGVGIDATPDDAAQDGTEIDGATDASIDGPIITSSCLAKWMAGTIRFNPATPLATINTTTYERDPYVSPDELTLLFSSSRSPSMGMDVWMATRPSKLVPFANPTQVAELNSPTNETRAALSANGLIAMISTDRPTSTGEFDVWQATRPTTVAPFGAPARTEVMSVESTASEYDPTLADGGLHLYLAPTSGGTQHIALATRSSVGSSFGMPTTLTELSGGNGDGDPTVSVDEKIIVFSSNRVGSGFAGGNLWYATRTSATAAFGTPSPVPDLNSAESDGDPQLSDDGCHVYFARSNPTTDWDMYEAVAQ